MKQLWLILHLCTGQKIAGGKTHNYSKLIPFTISVKELNISYGFTVLAEQPINRSHGFEESMRGGGGSSIIFLVFRLFAVSHKTEQKYKTSA